jgi:hypothetical protein
MREILQGMHWGHPRKEVGGEKQMDEENYTWNEKAWLGRYLGQWKEKRQSLFDKNK